MFFTSFLQEAMFQESVGNLPDGGLVMVDMSSVEEGEFLCFLLMVWRRVLWFLWVISSQQGVEGSWVNV